MSLIRIKKQINGKLLKNTKIVWCSSNSSGILEKNSDPTKKFHSTTNSTVHQANGDTKNLYSTKVDPAGQLKKVDNEEYTSTPQYPPILDMSFRKRIERKHEMVHEQIKRVKTIEEKQIKLNMPAFYGFKTYLLQENQVPYDSLPLAQHITRTHLIKSSSLPKYYNKVQIDENLTELSNEIQEALLMEVDGIQRLHDLRNTDISDIDKEDLIASNISQQINRILINSLADKFKHLQDAQIDLDPRVESCWYAGGMNPPKHIRKLRGGLKYMKEFEDDPTDRLMCYTGTPMLTLRSDLPLPPVIAHTDSENSDFEVPFFQYDPRVLGTFTTHRHMANVPGFWPDDPQTFGLLSLHKRGYLVERQKRLLDEQDNREALHTQGILASYAWLHAQANYLGFNTFNDVTYPLVTQTVVTNGKEWSFYIYQLNTLLFHSKYIHENPKKNVCWTTEELKLYEKVEDGKIVGLNEEVLKILLKLYSNVPEERLGVNLRPFLSNEEKLIADYEHDEKRKWLEREYKFLVSNRPRFKAYPEIYSWEKIYKIDHKTRPMDKKLRYFELKERPMDRTLDDRLPFYIPRKLRPDLPRWKGRYAPEFWP